MLGRRPTSTVGQAGGMPLIDVTYDGTPDEEVLRRLGELLPDVVGEAGRISGGTLELERWSLVT